MIDISYLQNIYKRKRDDQRVLHRGHITAIGTYETWRDFVAGFLDSGVNPSPATSKEDAFGWCATLFEPNGEEDAVNARNAEYGSRSRTVLAHRDGAHADSHLTLFFADLDNHKPEHPTISIDDLEAALRSYGLSFLLYTSFSHKTERHKCRIIIPIDRLIDRHEAFEIFIPFNHALNYQLDGSIYDPGDFLYGPPSDSDVRANLDGTPLAAEEWLKLSASLPEEVRNAVPRSDTKVKKLVATPEEIARAKLMMASQDSTDGVSINNPRYFKPEWFELADSLYCGGSHWSTMIGLLTKVWYKSQHSLSSFDMGVIYDELDAYWAGYLHAAYSSHERSRAINDAMSQVGALLPVVTNKPTDRDLHAAFKLLKGKKKKKK